MDCAVCGDISSGTHYGVVSCEGCKSFFKKFLKNMEEYTCNSGNGKCDLSPGTSLKGTRKSRCRSCRLAKCISLGMTAPQSKLQQFQQHRLKAAVEDASQNTKKEQDNGTGLLAKIESLNSCLVCGDESNGNFNFGVLTCEGCKAFFKRYASNPEEYVCEKDGNCDLAPSLKPDGKRKYRCKFCRIQKCFSVGMSSKRKAFPEDPLYNRRVRKKKLKPKVKKVKEEAQEEINDEGPIEDYELLEPQIEIVEQPSPFEPEPINTQDYIPFGADLLDCFGEGIKKNLLKLEKYHSKLKKDPKSLEKSRSKVKGDSKPESKEELAKSGTASKPEISAKSAQKSKKLDVYGDGAVTTIDIGDPVHDSPQDEAPAQDPISEDEYMPPLAPSESSGASEDEDLQEKEEEEIHEEIEEDEEPKPKRGRKRGRKRLNEDSAPKRQRRMKGSKDEGTKDEGPKDEGPKTELCPHCGKYYAKKSMYAHIARMHRNEPISSCPVCFLPQKNYQVKNKHVILTHPDWARENGYDMSRFETQLCEKCAKEFQSKQALKQHMRYQHQNEMIRKIPCEQCGKIMLEPQLKRHLLTHSAVREKFDCTVPGCGKSFNWPNNLKEHVTFCHPEISGPVKRRKRIRNKELAKLYVKRSKLKHKYGNPKTCPECSKIVPQRHFNNHMDVMHNKGSWSHPCPVEGCTGKAAGQTLINIHIRQVHPEYAKEAGLEDKPFKCDYCDKSFVYQHALKDHEKYHTDTSSTTCPICEKVLKSAMYVRYHIKTVHGEKDFECPIEGCGKKFSLNTVLKGHIRSCHKEVAGTLDLGKSRVDSERIASLIGRPEGGGRSRKKVKYEDESSEDGDSASYDQGFTPINYR